MAKNLLIVESPAKAKTIEKYLGADFTVKSSFGHIRDLAKKNDAIAVEKDYEPVYVIPEDKKKVVTELKKLAKSAETVWLATDEDREGEAISWHLCEVLGLNPTETKRIVFHEITKDAILRAVKNPRTINGNLVDAQQARRIIDRLVGFELSPLLWRKVSGGSSLSAGRVQSVAVRLIVEREEKISAFAPESSFRIRGEFSADDQGKAREFTAEMEKRLSEQGDAQAYLEACIGASFKVSDVQVKPSKRAPAAPFTTSTLQQEASRKLSFSVSRTMAVAQKLYESGAITYMRTDSVNLSDLALNQAKETIVSNYGEQYSHTRQFKTKNSSAQEAHEAIRPTDLTMSRLEDEDSPEGRLYRLIWLRTIASQMSEAQFEKTTVRIDVSTREEDFVAKGEVMTFDGFLKVYNEGTDEEAGDEIEGLLPPLAVSQNLAMNRITATERFSKPPARFTEASLVREMEAKGIGRPSTYAPTISTIQKRGYVEKAEREGKERHFRVMVLEDGKVEQKQETEIIGREKGKLFPTDIGILVNEFLTEHFDTVMDYGFTARIEQEFDEIAAGSRERVKVIDEFYKPFHTDIEKTMEEAERVTGERDLGVDPKSGKKVIARMGRYGPMVQLGASDDEEKPRYAKLVGEVNLATVTLEQALKLLSLPRTLGEYREDEVVIGRGRFGPYVRNKDKFYSIPKEEDPMTVTMERAIEIIVAKEEADAKKHIKSFEEEDIQVLNGRWGPYIKQGRKNYKIPKDKDPAALTLEECVEIIKTPKPVRKTRKKKA